MHQTIDYSTISNEAEKRKRAIQDIVNWVGLKKFTEVSSNIRNCRPPMTYEQFKLLCSLSGIQGYPVRVWAEDVGILIPEDDKAGEE